MRIDELWEKLDADAATGSTGTWLTRFALPQPSMPMLLAVQAGSGQRAFLLRTSLDALPSQHEWPDCRGLELSRMRLLGQDYLAIVLKDSACSDVFSALGEDVAPRIAAAPDAATATRTLLGRLSRWQKFLEAGRFGLSAEAQRGLYGELVTLRYTLLRCFPPAEVIAGWRGPTTAHQDFQFATGAIEVKTTSAKQPQAIVVTSERQLDRTGTPALFLHVVIVDERIVGASEARSGEGLSELVSDIRATVVDSEVAAIAFEDRLLDAGYLATDADRYRACRYTIRAEETFEVRAGFPCITEDHLAVGVGAVSYSLSLAACSSFRVSIEYLVSTLARPVASLQAGPAEQVT